MSDPGPYLWLIPLLPLVASILTAFLGPRWLRQHSHWPCIVASLGSCLISFLVLIAVAGGNNTVFHSPDYTWFQAGLVEVSFQLRADGLTALMLVTVTLVSSLIAIY